MPHAARPAHRPADGARTGSRRGRSLPRRPSSSAPAWRIVMRSASPAAATFALARATKSASNSTPTSSRAGKRRAIAISQRPPPQWTSTTRPPRAEIGDELRQRGERLLEEDRDVLGRQPLDRDAVAVGALADGLAGPEEVEPSRPSRARRPPHGRTGRRGIRAGRRRGGSTPRPRRRRGGRHRASRGPARRLRRPGPNGLGSGPVSAARSSVVSPAGPARGARRTAQARCRGRRARCGGTRQGCRSGRRSGRRAASSRGLSHGGARPSGYRSGHETGARRNGSACATGSVRRWIPTASSSMPWPATSTGPSRRSCWPTRTGSTRSRCGCSVTRATPRRRPRTRSCARTVRCAGTTRRGSASCACVRWLATIVLNLCRSRIGRRVAARSASAVAGCGAGGTMEPAARRPRSGRARTSCRCRPAAGPASS